MTPTTQPQTFAEITPEQIQDWKAKHGEHSLREIDVPARTHARTETNGETVIDMLSPAANFVARVPSRATMDLVTQHSLKGDGIAANKSLIAGTILGGDMTIMEADATVYLAVLERLNELLAARPATLKKL